MHTVKITHATNTNTSVCKALKQRAFLNARKYIFCARQVTQVAVVDRRQKNSCVHVSFTWKRDFFAGGGLAYETPAELSGANSENSA